MTETRRTDGDSTRTKPSERAAEHTPNPTLLDHMGGLSGLVYTGLPIVTFVVANTIAGLHVAIASPSVPARESPYCGCYARSRSSPPSPVCSALRSPRSSRTRRGPGALAVGRVIWNLLNGNGNAWRMDKPSRLGFDIATSALALLVVLWAVRRSDKRPTAIAEQRLIRVDH